MFPPDDAASALREALRLPSCHRWVAEYLFAGLNLSPFHPSHIVPPPSLLPSLAICASHTIACFPHMHPHDTTYASQVGDCSVAKHVELLLVPIASHASILVGYAMGAGVDHEYDAAGPACNPFAPPFLARFVFDSESGELLLATQPAGAPVMGLIAMGPTCGLLRDQRNFVVPSDDYGFGRLPVIPLRSHQSLEQRLETHESQCTAKTQKEVEPSAAWEGLGTAAALPAASDAQVQPALADADVTNLLESVLGDSPKEGPSISVGAASPTLLSSLLSPEKSESDDAVKWPALQQPDFKTAVGRTPSSAAVFDPTPISHIPWSSCTDRAISDGVALLKAPTSAADSRSEVVNPSMTRSIDSLLVALLGRYDSATARFDTLDTARYTYTTTFSGRIRSEVVKVKEVNLRTLRRTFAHSYYLAVLCVSPDRKLVAAVRQNSGRAKEERAQQGMAELEKQPRRSAQTECRDEQLVADFADAQRMRGLVEESVQKRQRPIAPATCLPRRPQSHLPSQASSVQAIAGETAEQRMKRVADARRRRNRLSAARSNSRKREAMAAIREEIERNRLKITELAAIRQASLAENARLRRLRLKYKT